jgi:hypothetical protein
MFLKRPTFLVSAAIVILCAISCGIIVGPLLTIANEQEALGHGGFPVTKVLKGCAVAVLLLSIAGVVTVIRFPPGRRGAELLLYTISMFHIVLLAIIEFHILYWR